MEEHKNFWLWGVSRKYPPISQHALLAFTHAELMATPHLSSATLSRGQHPGRHMLPRQTGWLVRPSTCDGSRPGKSKIPVLQRTHILSHRCHCSKTLFHEHVVSRMSFSKKLADRKNFLPFHLFPLCWRNNWPSWVRVRGEGVGRSGEEHPHIIRTAPHCHVYFNRQRNGEERRAEGKKGQEEQIGFVLSSFLFAKLLEGTTNTTSLKTEFITAAKYKNIYILKGLHLSSASVSRVSFHVLLRRPISLSQQ